MVSIKLISTNKKFGKVEVLKGIDLEIEDKEFMVLVGPSGCGKTTTLNLIAGLEYVTTGQIFFDEHDVTELPPNDRKVAMVFQSYALYPHMNVKENMSFGLKLAKIDKSDIEERVNRAAKILGIGELLDRKPKELSGGQRQRVALGRAIVRDPTVFLLDEPLSNLDAKLRVQMRAHIKKLHRQVQTTFVYVTHDQVEAMSMANRITIMDNGVIQQVGTPDEVYNQPANEFVAGFIGSPSMNFFKCEVRSNSDGTKLRLGTFDINIPQEIGDKLQDYSKINIGIRPEHISINQKPVENSIKVIVDVVEYLGAGSLVTVLFEDETRLSCAILVDGKYDGKIEETAFINWESEKMNLFNIDTKVNILLP
ncbi:MAG: sn-glycerol-3-phosphate import ATP-binding protein UgpC [Candidatus Heimdallarchaeota archaeon LC_2]|nr:MAG: sn-glycerol-3-phosphate import ATP-binding protein UgpC [Candidatus Heimdallarchaeota archaeon LC_2]